MTATDLLPTPRYTIGERVYYNGIEPSIEVLPCPDCGGTRAWKAITPLGIEHELACPRCSDWILNGIPSLKVHRYRPVVHTLVIGAIRTNTHPFSGDDKVDYMSSTTGSGNVYKESLLYPTEAEAMEVATVRAALKNAEIDREPAVIEARRFANLTLTDATIVSLRDAIYASWASARNWRWNIEELINDGDTSDLARELRDTLARMDRYQAENFLDIRHPLDELLIEATNTAVGMDVALTRFYERTKMPRPAKVYCGKYDCRLNFGEPTCPACDEARGAAGLV